MRPILHGALDDVNSAQRANELGRYGKFLIVFSLDYFRASLPPLAHSYRQTCRLAQARGYEIPSLTTARRFALSEARLLSARADNQPSRPARRNN